MTPQAARHRRRHVTRPTVQPNRARRDTATYCGSTARVACNCGNAYECRGCGTERHTRSCEEG